MLGSIGLALGGIAAAAAASQEGPTLLAGLTNPALETFKGPRGKGQQFIPGKGLRDHEELLAGLKNPALETFKGPRGKGQQFTICTRRTQFTSCTRRTARGSL